MDRTSTGAQCESVEEALSLLAVGKTSPAVVLLQEAIAQAPQLSSQPYQILATLTLDAKHYQQALGVIEQGLRYFPEDFSLHCCMGRARVAMGNLRAAYHHYKQANHIEPGHLGCVHKIVVCLHQLSCQHQISDWILQAEQYPINTADLQLLAEIYDYAQEPHRLLRLRQYFPELAAKDHPAAKLFARAEARIAQAIDSSSAGN